MMRQFRKVKEYWRPDSLRLRFVKGKHGWLWPGHSLWRLLSCLDTDEVSIWTAWKKYRKRVRVSCKLSKGTKWMEAQMKRFRDSHWDVWGHDHKISRTEQKCTLAEDCSSFEMRRMTTRTDQLFCIVEATGFWFIPGSLRLRLKA